MSAYYNEFDAAAAHILNVMIEEGVIAPGIVDTRSIKDVQPDDLIGFTQVHLFAEGGFWSIAARSAGWPDHEPIWTASCPCQPFSAAGKGAGTDDPRHLWPDVYRLARARRPVVLVGEQVAGAAGYGWFDGVRADLARENYASRSVDFPACSVDAPHQRNRQYWFAMADNEGGECGARLCKSGSQQDRNELADRDGIAGVTQGDAFSKGLEGQRRDGDRNRGPEQAGPIAEADGAERASHVASANALRLHRQQSGEALGAKGASEVEGDQREWVRADNRQFPNDRRNGTYWSDAEWIVCHDEKARRTKSGLCFLVDGLPGRVDLWRVGGNAIVPEAAKEVLAAIIDVYGLPSEWRVAA